MAQVLRSMTYTIENESQGWIKPLIILLTGSVLLHYVSNFVLMDENLIFDFYQDKFSYEEIKNLINYQDHWKWLIYPLFLAYLLLKLFVVTCVLMAGLFFAEYNIKFSRVFRIVIIAEYVFLLSSLIKVLWFTFVDTDYSLQDLQYFSPLALSNLVGNESLPVWLAPAAMSLSLFEVAYWLLLAWGLQSLMGKSFKHALQIVACSYGAGWLLFQVFTLFLIINFT